MYTLPKIVLHMHLNKNIIFFKIIVKIGTPPAPALVADSLTSTSLSLEWEGQRHSNLSYLVQWHYEEISGAWQYCRNQTWGENSIVHVDNLQPYTKYRVITYIFKCSKSFVFFIICNTFVYNTYSNLFSFEWLFSYRLIILILLYRLPVL